MAAFDNANFNYNADNTQRYNDTIAGYKNMLDTNQSFANSMYGSWQDLYNQQASFGDAQRLALQQQYEKAGAQQDQSMMSRGLGNTTVLDSARRGLGYDYANNQLTLNDQLLQRQNAIRQNELGWQQGVAQNYSNIQGQQAAFQGNQLNQKYGIEGQYLAQYNLQNLQNQGQKDVANVQASNQGLLAAQQQRYASSNQDKAFNNEDYVRKNYGYW